jgi:Cbb3-type cytochrome oxidase, subunit 3
MSYDALRHFADSYGLAAMVLLYFGLCAWVFRPGSRSKNQNAAHLIFAEDGESAAADRNNDHG